MKTAFCPQCQKETQHLFGKCIEGEHFKQEMRECLEKHFAEIEERDKKERTTWPPIRSCPFCGGDDLHVGSSGNDSGDFSDTVAVICRCGAQGPDHFDSRKEAINLWNKRQIQFYNS